jgi:hypothetical protein
MDRPGEFNILFLGLQKRLKMEESSTEEMREGATATTFTENGRMYTD